MNKTALIVIILLVGVGAWWFLAPKGGTASTAPTGVMENKTATTEGQTTVELKDFAYNPKTITVKVGSKVTIVNKDLTGHSVTADDKSFDSGVLTPGESTTLTFDKAGTFGYHCTPHPNMTLTVVVE
jgi:plastocyanin